LNSLIQFFLLSRSASNDLICSSKKMFNSLSFWKTVLLNIISLTDFSPILSIWQKFNSDFQCLHWKFNFNHIVLMCMVCCVFSCWFQIFLSVSFNSLAICLEINFFLILLVCWASWMFKSSF
jgi:hypothetical protein